MAGAELDWRYYLLRYPCMREGNSGIYYGADYALGYELTMLSKSVQRSWYRDPYLYAIWRESGSSEEVPDPWFSGYSTNERWMRLERSQTGIRSVPTGIAVQAPVAEQHRITFESVCLQHTDVGETRGRLATRSRAAGAQRQARRHGGPRPEGCVVPPGTRRRRPVTRSAPPAPTFTRVSGDDVKHQLAG